MKFLRNILLLLLIYLTGVSFAFSQNNKEKSGQKPVEIKANVLVKNLSGNWINDIKVEDLKIYEDGVEQKITYFAKKEPVLNLGIVVDNSGSMRMRLDEFVKAGSTIIESLTPADEIFVVRFVDSDKIEIIQDWTSNKKDLQEALENMYIDAGQSAVLDAIYLSAEKLLERERKARSKRYAILLISDAEERDSYYNFDEMTSLFKKTDLQVFLLSFAENAPSKKKKARRLSHLIALETGGTVHSLSEKHKDDELNNALKAIMLELRSNYIVGYNSTNQKRDGLPRKLTVQIAENKEGEKRQGFVRESFIVPKE